MLQTVQRKALELEEGSSLLPLQANLCRLGCLADGSFDYGLSMFSTLGMIRSRAARKKSFGEAARILRPGGRLARPCITSGSIFATLKAVSGCWASSAGPCDFSLVWATAG